MAKIDDDGCGDCGHPRRAHRGIEGQCIWHTQPRDYQDYPEPCDCPRFYTYPDYEYFEFRDTAAAED